MNDYQPAADMRRNWRIFLGVALALAVWGLVDVQRRGVVDLARPDLHMTDFTVYTEAGAAFFDGREPYRVANIRGWTYLYPPLFALCMAPLHALHPQLQVAVWFVISAALCFGCYFECRKLVAAATAGGLHGLPAWLLPLALAAVLFPALNCLQRGQIGVAKLYPLLVGFRLVARGQRSRDWFLGGVMLALPIVLKFTPLLPAACCLAVLWVAPRGETDPPPLWRAGWATLGTVSGCALFFLAIPAGLLGWNANLRHLHTWYHDVLSQVNDVRSADFGGDVVSMRNQSLSNSAYRFGNWAMHVFGRGPDDLLIDTTETAVGTMPMDRPAVTRVVLAFRLAALALLAGAAWRLARRATFCSQGVAFGLACVATLVVSPVARGHYFVLFLPGMIFVPLWLQDRGRPRAAFAAALAPAVLSVAHYVALHQAGRIGLLGLGTTAWLFAICVVALGPTQPADQPAPAGRPERPALRLARGAGP